ncbi:g3326 [Coccomyxa elongata]
MARNEEKAQSMLNRLLTAKQQEGKEPKQKRPYLATECHDVVEADKWRQQILREIGRKVMQIQNAGLGDHRIRDLNDEINKLIREKGHWEKRIVELGGPDYAKSAPKVQDSQGFEIQGATGKGSGYRYFGAAKQLPGVRELFEKEAPRQLRRTRHQMYQHINADYYGFRDEEDGVLEKVEAEAERNVRQKLMEEWAEKEAERQTALAGVAGGMEDANATADEPQFVAYVPLPDQKEIEARVVQKKKAELLAKYSTPALQAAQQEAKALLSGQ